MRKYHVVHIPGTYRFYYCGCDARSALQELLREGWGLSTDPSLNAAVNGLRRIGDVLVDYKRGVVYEESRIR